MRMRKKIRAKASADFLEESNENAIGGQLSAYGIIAL